MAKKAAGATTPAKKRGAAGATTPAAPSAPSTQPEANKPGGPSGVAPIAAKPAAPGLNVYSPEGQLKRKFAVGEEAQAQAWAEERGYEVRA